MSESLNIAKLKTSSTLLDLKQQQSESLQTQKIDYNNINGII